MYQPSMAKVCSLSQGSGIQGMALRCTEKFHCSGAAWNDFTVLEFRR